MASKPLSLAEPAPGGGPAAVPAPVPAWLRLTEAATLAALLALAGTSLIGYRYGDSNHGITVPILKRLMDPGLYPGDVMVATAESFPTVFYRILALLLPGPQSIPAAFFFLYVATMAATFAGIYRIGRWAGGEAAGALAVLFAVPVRIGLAGEALYRPAFSHSHVASALAPVRQLVQPVHRAQGHDGHAQDKPQRRAGQACAHGRTQHHVGAGLSSRAGDGGAQSSSRYVTRSSLTASSAPGA